MRRLLEGIRPLHIALAFGLLAAVFSYVRYNTALLSGSFLEKLELRVLDTKFRLRGRQDIEPTVVIAAGDERTINRLGLWGTWDRAAMARMIRVLGEAKADLVAFDMVFADETGIDHRNAKRLREVMRSTANEGNELSAALTSRTLQALLVEALSGDQKLSTAFEEYSSRVVQGFIANPEPEPGKPPSNPQKHLEALEVFVMQEIGDGIRYQDQGEAAARAGAEQNIATLAIAEGVEPKDLHLVKEAKGELLLPRTYFLDQAEYLGFFSVDPDSDGTMRRVPMLFRHGNVFLPSLTLSAASLHFGSNPMLIAHDKIDGAIGHIVFALEGGKTRMIPVDHDGTLLVNYYGESEERIEGRDGEESTGVFPRVSLADVYCFENPDCPAAEREKFDPLSVRGKVVIVAVTAIGTYDQRVTPFSPVVPGVEVHAAALQNLLRGDPLERDDLDYQIEMLLSLCLALLLAWGLTKLPVSFGTLLVFGISLGWWFIDTFVCFAVFQKWFHQVPIQMQIYGTWVGINVWGYLTEGREKALLKKEFATVLAPTVVDQLLENPELAGLGGAERDLTVMFSDIRGFTSISEKLSPEGLTAFLNEYLTPMTEILMKHQGTLDKYMGDAIMAFWGAPIEQADHSVRACYAALDMMDELEEMKAGWRAEGKPEIDIGIGLNSGMMRVGFMGSERMRNYTLLGDNVNLGSRLEGVNKEYGTHIIISEYTREAAGDAIYARELDSIRVKGKQEPVVIFELRGKGTPELAEHEFLGRFHEALDAYKKKRFHLALGGFQALRAEYPDDHPTRLYIERCMNFLSHPPPPSWDGVYEMKTK